ncbi:MAG: bifunctional folylpolyglutamate synthase/dihydrofolate synthase [Clostridia bacterium]|nr:bifunctional folylpolyglutamate synthase/dihydrofolate synthase [Clostridia bacterium]
MDYRETLEYIHNINWSFCKPGLERINVLCEKLGHPERELKVIHVGGTNGKGSVCAMLDSILRASGRRVGLYTSPYIRQFNERIQVDGVPIEDEALIELTELVRPIADTMEDKPTEFELITAIAFEHFRRKKCDVVILEVGLGGRLDSTNVIASPLLSVITGIDFDHTAILGNTLEEIAAEKAGIIKPGRPCLFGGEDGAALRTVQKNAKEKRSAFHHVDRSSLRVIETSLEGTVFDFGVLRNLHLPLLGVWQPQNAATVLTALDILRGEGVNVSEDAIREGLSRVRWQARFELMRRDPVVICDGGHNPQGIAGAVESIKTYFHDQKVILLMGVMEDKAHGEMVSCLASVAHRVFTVKPSNPRAMAADALAAEFESLGVSATACATCENAVSLARRAAKDENRPLICLGSLYLYNEIADLI